MTFNQMSLRKITHFWLFFVRNDKKFVRKVAAASRSLLISLVPGQDSPVIHRSELSLKSETKQIDHELLTYRAGCNLKCFVPSDFSLRRQSSFGAEIELIGA